MGSFFSSSSDKNDLATVETMPVLVVKSVVFIPILYIFEKSKQAFFVFRGFEEKYGHGFGTSQGIRGIYLNAVCAFCRVMKARLSGEWHKEGQKTRYISVKSKKAGEEKGALVVPMK